MKYSSLPILLVLFLLPLASQGSPALAESLDRHPDIVSRVIGDGRFEVLAAALNQAGLIQTLRGKGPFTVLAPTDEAFAQLPEGVVADLLRPERKAALQRVLLAHVIAGEVPSSALLPVGSVKTLAKVDFATSLRISGATVIEVDIPCSNGVIHVIDSVLVPPAEHAPASPDASAILHAAIEKGAPMYNTGDAKGCADVYRAAAMELTAGGLEMLSDFALSDMQRALSSSSEDASKYAWVLRDAFDRTLADLRFRPTMEAELPAGFPAPGPVGRVMRKTYPKYRAARARGDQQMGSFWVLFQHIKKNDVEMTSPVEMTMDENMRMEDMAFLYGSPKQGTAGTQGSVDVLDLEGVQVLSIGMRGQRSKDTLKQAKHLVQARAQALGLKEDGAWRVFGYNSPMVAADDQYWELQVPVVGQ